MERKRGAQVLGCKARASALPQALPGVPSASTAWTVPPLQGLSSPGTSPGNTGHAPRGSEARMPDWATFYLQGLKKSTKTLHLNFLISKIEMKVIFVSRAAYEDYMS